MSRRLLPYLTVALIFIISGCAGPLIAQEPDRVYDASSANDVQHAIIESMQTLGFRVVSNSSVDENSLRITGRNTPQGFTVDTRGGGSRAIPFSLIVLVTDAPEGVEVRLETDSQQSGPYGSGSQNFENAIDRFLSNLDSRLR